MSPRTETLSNELNAAPGQETVRAADLDDERVRGVRRRAELVVVTSDHPSELSAPCGKSQSDSTCRAWVGRSQLSHLG